MQFYKKTRPIGITSMAKALVGIIFIISIFTISIIMLDKVNFPKPTKSIEKQLSNENFKIIK
tara:strand:- start:139 stop:324 length:186 start_codon:yes stop_codon:yes gene_type:complete